jgi:glutathione S-transferase
MRNPVLVLGNKNYSSWSMRAWLLLKWLNYEFDEIVIPLYRPDSRAAVLRYSPSGLLPALIDGESKIWDTFSIILHLADRHPEIWPTAPAKRAFVRSICSEMHAGFAALRSSMPHNGRGRDRRVPMTADLRRDIERVAAIWSEGHERFAGDAPWLAGEFGISDIMFAPVAGRFRTYGVFLDGAAEDYRMRLLDHPLVARWYRDGQDEQVIIPGAEVGIVNSETSTSHEGG